MKKTMILMVLFLLFGNYLFSQTWTERDDDDGSGLAFDCEFKVITKEEWNRLVRQQEAKYQYASIIFTDILQFSSGSVKVISGRKPTFQGYYYVMYTLKPRNDNTRAGLFMMGNNMGLIYGNSRTGNVSLMFSNSYASSRVGSDSYTRRYNQCIRWVNGEE